MFNRTSQRWETLDFEYPHGQRIHYRDDLELTFEEALSGVLLDITHKSKVVGRENIISIGHGTDTKYLRPEKAGSDEG